MVQLLEIYHTAQEGCIFLGNMYNDLRDDLSWQPIEDIVCTMEPPQLINQRSQFQFAQSDLNNIKTMFKKVYFK